MARKPPAERDGSTRHFPSRVADGYERAPSQAIPLAVGFEDPDFTHPQIGIAAICEIALQVSENELERCQGAWEPSRPRYGRGVLAKSPHELGPASQDAISDDFD